MYADDTTIYFGSDNPDRLQTTIQNALSEAHKWLTENRLVVNASKSEFIILGNNSRMECYNPCFELPSRCNKVRTKLPSCRSTKLLVVVIDCQLSFKNQIDHLLAKLAPKLGLLRRLSCVLHGN